MEISKEGAKELIAFKGEVRGAVFRTDIQFILREKGEAGLKKVEEGVEKLGYPFKYSEIRVMSFYPIGLRAISLLVIKQTLGFSDEKIKKMGEELPKSAFLTRLFMKYYKSDIKRFYYSTPKIWRLFVTVGEFVTVNFDKKNKTGIIRVENFKIHPIFCVYLLGIITTLLKMLTGSSKASCQEVKCPFKSDQYHELLMKW